MKRWKFTAANLFQGRWGLLWGPLLILPTAGVYALLIYGIIHGDPAAVPSLIAVLSVILALLLIIWTVAFLMLHAKTDEEREKIANAAPVEWLPLPKSDLYRLQSTQSGIKNGALIVIGVFGFAFLLHGISDGFTPALLYAALFLGGIAAVGFTVYYFIWRFWHSIDESAEVAEIPVDHCFSRTHTTKTGKYTDYYQVCYLPDGRYVFNIGEYKLKCVRIVRFCGRMRLLPPQQ